MLKKKKMVKDVDCRNFILRLRLKFYLSFEKYTAAALFGSVINLWVKIDGFILYKIIVCFVKREKNSVTVYRIM